VRTLPSSKTSAWAQAARDIGIVAVIAALAVASLAKVGHAGIVSALGTAAVGAVVAALVLRALSAPGAPGQFGLANRVTLLRAGIAVLFCGLGAEGVLTGEGLAARPIDGRDAWVWLLPLGALGAFVLDGIDGWLARRLQLESALGARFDMEVDALLIFALSLLVLASDRANAWVLVAGLLRYVFVAAGWAWPALAAPLPPNFRRKAVCVLLGIALTAALVPVVPAASAGILAGAGVLAILASFAADTIWLLLRRSRRGALAGVNE
jgi:phosphatidylglycerophosphate synthase